MKNIKLFKQFIKESVFVSKEESDDLLDKINQSGINSLSDIEKNRLTLFSEEDKEIIEIIDQMGDLTNQFREVNNKIKKLVNQGNVEEAKSLMHQWDSLNTKLTLLENKFKKWGIELGDENLYILMKKIRPDAYNRADID